MSAQQWSFVRGLRVGLLVFCALCHQSHAFVSHASLHRLVGGSSRRVKSSLGALQLRAAGSDEARFDRGSLIKGALLTSFSLVSTGASAKTEIFWKPKAEVPTVAEKDAFYAKYPYERPSDVIPFVLENSQKGDSSDVLRALDCFGQFYPNYRLGQEKGEVLEEVAAAIQPKTALEIGTFWGYSAIRTARRLKEGGKLYCIEYNPNNAEVARQLIEHAGLKDKVKIFVGKSTWTIPKVASEVGHADMVFLDHNKKLYGSDLLLLEKHGIVGKGTTLAADNVVYPGAPDFLAYVQTGPRWETKLVEAELEYNLDKTDPRGVFRGEGGQKWKEGTRDAGTKDAISFSRCLEDADSQLATRTSS